MRIQVEEKEKEKEKSIQLNEKPLVKPGQEDLRSHPETLRYQREDLCSPDAPLSHGP